MRVIPNAPAFCCHDQLCHARHDCQCWIERDRDHLRNVGTAKPSWILHQKPCSYFVPTAESTWVLDDDFTD